MNFQFAALPWNIIFAAGARKRLPEELAKLGYSRALVLTTPHQAGTGREIVEQLGDKAAGLFDQAMMHVPGETLDQAMEEVARLGADCSRFHWRRFHHRSWQGPGVSPGVAQHRAAHQLRRFGDDQPLGGDPERAQSDPARQYRCAYIDDL